MFFTPPKIEPLGIDLDIDPLDQRNSGSCPAQFWCRTTDNRPVFIRYRGGMLSIDVGKVGQSFPKNVQKWDFEELLNAQVGPPLHGDILIEQACQISGMTIRNESIADLEDIVREARMQDPIYDLSGRTTFWNQDLLMTRRTRRILVEKLLREIDDLCVMSLNWSYPDPHSLPRPRLKEVKTAQDCSDYMWLCDRHDFEEWEDELLNTPSRFLELRRSANLSTHMEIRRSFPSRGSSNQIRGKRFNSKLVYPMRVDSGRLDLGYSRKLNRPIHIYHQRMGKIGAQFKNSDSIAKTFIEKIESAIRSIFLEQVAVENLETGELVETREVNFWYCPEIASWCNAAPHRYLHGLSYGLHSHRSESFGLKPA